MTIKNFGLSNSIVFLPTSIASQSDLWSWFVDLDKLLVIHFDFPFLSAINPSKELAYFKIT